MKSQLIYDTLITLSFISISISLFIFLKSEEFKFLKQSTRKTKSKTTHETIILQPEFETSIEIKTIKQQYTTYKKTILNEIEEIINKETPINKKNIVFYEVSI